MKVRIISVRKTLVLLSILFSIVVIPSSISYAIESGSILKSNANYSMDQFSNKPYGNIDGLLFLNTDHSPLIPKERATGGPDGFGYVWDDSVSYNWIDVSDGINTGLNFNNHVSDAIGLPFPFTYYGIEYNQIYIQSHGCLSFTDTTFSYTWSMDSAIPDPDQPNNVIAPFWGPHFPSTSGWVRYKSGGVIPNRYFVIEWHDLKFYSENSFTFQTILHENGDIVFQFGTMYIGGSYACSMSGIENSSGVIGLAYLNICGFPQSNSAVHFYIPVETNWNLMVAKVGQGTVLSSPPGINCGTTCSASFANNTVVTLSALPAEGWTFTGWSGDCTGMTCQVTMDQARSVTATFKADEEPFRFVDVPEGYWAFDWIYRLYAAGITKGCSEVPPFYCPELDVTRAEMAVFLMRGLKGPEYDPPTGTGTLFADVQSDYWALDWIEQIYAEGITVGCDTDPLRYCPNQPVTRAEMAVFLLRSKYGDDYVPPVVTHTGFDDVPITHWAANWIAQLAVEGITTGVTPTIFDPEGFVTRAQMAVFLVRNFELP